MNVRIALRAALLAFAVALPTLPALRAQAEPTAEEIEKFKWQRLVHEADDRIADARHTLETATITRDTAARQTVMMPTGPNLAARAAAEEAVKAAQASIAAAEKAKVDLLEQARQAGVPPGWFR